VILFFLFLYLAKGEIEKKKEQGVNLGRGKEKD
jgi:hypothetical protein